MKGMRIKSVVLGEISNVALELHGKLIARFGSRVVHCQGRDIVFSESERSV
jgi:hypothetical protein